MKQRVLKLLRVSERPQLPPGDRASIDCFRASRAHLRYSVLMWVPKQILALGALLASLAFFGGLDPPVEMAGLDRVFEVVERIEIKLLNIPVDLEWLLVTGESIAITAFLVQGVFTGALLKIRWELRWYMVGDEVLRIREGLWHLREQTMTIANIQNMIIRQGPVQRFFGISDLIVHTAGGGAGEDANDASGTAGKGNLHTGHIRGVTNASEIQERIQSRLRQLRGAGLGNDARDNPRQAEAFAMADAEAGAALLAEVRGLRVDLADR
ncbi:MAG: PH domain-containing protein [Acidobacteriota bacterium]|nr:PH domain-containing protein [Acidobacteriota bacterium]